MRTLAFLGACVLICSAGAQAVGQGEARISGHVYYADGSPVHAARVGVFCFGGINGFIEPPAAYTDERGEYQIAYPACNDGWLTASKPSEGFPDASLAVYGRGHTSLRLVHLLPGSELHDINLRFEKPDQTVTFAVQSRGKPVANARILIEWPEDSKIMTSQTVPPNGIFFFVLPKHAVEITVSAPGFQNWHYRHPIRSRSHVVPRAVRHADMTVELKPVEYGGLPLARR